MDSYITRLHIIRNHLQANNTEVVICAAFRSPITKAKRGDLRETSLEEMLAQVIRHTLNHTKIKPELVQDLVIGNVLANGSGVVNARLAGFLGGLPDTTPVQTINRLCSSGLEAAATVANAIKAGQIRVGMAGGFETMSQHDITQLFSKEGFGENVFKHKDAGDCLIQMGSMSDNVAREFSVSREKMDQLAAESHAKAANAAKKKLFDSEIVPISTYLTSKDGEKIAVTVTQDDGIRRETSLETLSKLKPAFNPSGVTTAGNSSQTSDGASILLLASREAAIYHNLPILARWVGYSVIGLAPYILGIGPALAIPKVLSQCNLSIQDIDLFELNEAFASQATYCVEKLGIDRSKLNVCGGAIALGHPLGATGARLICTMLPEMKRRKSRYGVISMCVGTGMGAAAVIENLQIN